MAVVLVVVVAVLVAVVVHFSHTMRVVYEPI